MIERIASLAINGNVVEDYNIESSLNELKDKVNELVEVVNEMTRKERVRNRATHKNIEKVGEGELLWCKDCQGGEAQLWEATCLQLQGMEGW